MIFKDVKIEACNIDVGKFDFNRKLRRSNMILNLAFLMTSNDCFTETKFDKPMKETKHDNLLVRHLMSEFMHDSINLLSTGTTQDLINNNPFSTKKRQVVESTIATET